MSITTLKRIDLSKVLEAFASANITPSQNDGNCIMAAVCYPKSVEEALELGFDYNYVNGVIDGFDGWSEDRSNQFDPLKYKLGRADGEASWKISQENNQ